MPFPIVPAPMTPRVRITVTLSSLYRLLLRLRAAALALRVLRLRAVALALRVLRLRAVALALRARLRRFRWLRNFLLVPQPPLLFNTAVQNGPDKRKREWLFLWFLSFIRICKNDTHARCPIP